MAEKIENGIKMFFHCKNCMDVANKRTTERLAMGWTIKGVQVWCENCDTCVVALDFRGMKIAHDFDPKGPHKEDDSKTIVN